MAEPPDASQPMTGDEADRRLAKSDASQSMGRDEAHIQPEGNSAGHVSSSAEGQSPRKNPFVGPVPLTKEDPIFGRDREIRELYDKLISQRIVVLHSPSGAGKTSLVMAGLLPRLEAEGLVLLPVIRMGGEPEKDFQPNEKYNPYIYNLVLALDSPGADESKAQSGLPESSEKVEQRRKRHQQLAEMNLAEYLAQPPSTEGASPRAIVFDQFEEFITSSLAGPQAKRDFFRQVGDALRDRTLWALFAIRDDFLGALETYATLIPTQFSNTFRLDFLDYTAALEAVRLPLASQGISYAEQADEQLVNDLRTVMVQTPDGEIKPDLGIYVEPVQLQVVCRRLYDRLDLANRLDKVQIDRQDLASVGDVNQALAEYYREQVAQVGRKRSVERKIRDWIENYLITQTGLRGQVLMEKETSGGLDNRLIWELVDAHLVRGDKRRGVTWFELAHDRLVRPVLADNESWRKDELRRVQQQAWEWKKQLQPDGLLLRGKELEQALVWASENPDELDPLDQEYLEKSRLWRREHLSTVQLKASQWNEQARPQGLLLKGAELAQAESWAAEHPHELTEDESAFLAESRKMEMEQLRARQQEKLAEEYKRNRRRMFLIISSFLALVVLISTLVMLNNSNQTAIALSFVAATKDAYGIAQSTLAAKNVSLANQQSTQAAQSKALALEQSTLAADQQQLAGVNAQIALTAMAQEATAVAARESAELSANQALARQLASQARSFLERKPDLGILLGIEAYQVDPHNWDTRSTLLAGLQTGLKQSVLPYELNIPTRLAKTNCIDISPDGRLVSWGGSDGKIVLWDVAKKTIRELQDPKKVDILSQSFSPVDPNLLVTGNKNNELLFWDLQSGNPQRVETRGVTLDGKVVFQSHIRFISFSPDGSHLAIHGQGQFISVLNVSTKVLERAFDSVADFYWDLEWSPGNRYLAAAGDDNSLYIFDPYSGNTIINIKNPDTGGQIYNVDWTKDSQSVAFAGSSGSGIAIIRFYDLVTRKMLPETLNYISTNVYNVSYNHPDANILAAAGFNAPLVLWRLKDNIQFPPLPEYGDYQNGLAFRGDLLAYLSNDAISVYTIVVPDQLSKALPPASQDLPFMMNVGQDGKLLLFTPDNAGGSLEIRSSGENLGDRPGTEIPESIHFYRAAFSTNDSLFLENDDSGEVYQWSKFPSGKTQKVLTGLPAGINAMAVSSDGSLLAVSHCPTSEGELSADVCAPLIHLWDLTEQDAISQPVTVTQGMVTSLAFSPGGNILASGSQDGTIYLTDIKTGQPIGLPLGGYPVSIASLAFSPDGITLAAGTDQGTMFLWDVSSGQMLGSPFEVSHLPVGSLAFSPDGKALYTGTQNGQLSIWDVDFGSWVQRACSIAGRPLNEAEWKQFLSDRAYSTRSCK